MSKTEKQKTGDIGEKIAGLFLKSKGFEIQGTNYRKPWGEIDIIVHRKGKIHFIEVKTVKTRENSSYVSCETVPNFFEKSISFISSLINLFMFQNRADKGLSLRRSATKRSDGERRDLGERNTDGVTGLKVKRLIKNGIILEKFLPPEKSYLIKEIFNGDEYNNGYRPEDNLHPWKLKRLKKAILSYLEEKHLSEEDDWQFDAVTVRLYEKERVALVEYLENIIL